MALGDARSELGLWVPPEVELDFTIVKKSELPSATVLRPARWWSTVPAWAQAAAAILVFAAGAAIANVQVKSGPDGILGDDRLDAARRASPERAVRRRSR